MPSFQSTLFPTLETVMNVARARTNDMFPGRNGQNGRILTNDNPSTLVYINSASRNVQRRLRQNGATFPIVDNFSILDLPPVNPSNDPSVFVYVGFNGYFDGTSLHGAKKLPNDCLQITACASRTTGSNLPFGPMCQPQSQLPNQYPNNSMWLWRWSKYRLNMTGASVNKDIQFQYISGQPPFNTLPADFAETEINILDCEEAFGLEIAIQDVEARGGDTTKLETKLDQAYDDMITDWVRRAQTVTYRRPSYQGGGSSNTDSGATGQTGVTA